MSAGEQGRCAKCSEVILPAEWTIHSHCIWCAGKMIDSYPDALARAERAEAALKEIVAEDEQRRSGQVDYMGIPDTDDAVRIAREALAAVSESSDEQ